MAGGPPNGTQRGGRRRGGAARLGDCWRSQRRRPRRARGPGSFAPRGALPSGARAAHRGNHAAAARQRQRQRARREGREGRAPPATLTGRHERWGVGGRAGDYGDRGAGRRRGDAPPCGGRAAGRRRGAAVRDRASRLLAGQRSGHRCYTYPGYTYHLLWQVSDQGIRYAHYAHQLTICSPAYYMLTS